MDIAQAIHLYTRTCAEGVSDDSIVQSLVSGGCATDLALDVTRFVPIAFGRQVLSGVGISFPDEYWLLSTEGEVIQRDTLSGNAVYAEAIRLAPSSMSKAVVFRSSEVNAINSALNRGSSPTNLRAAPVAVFTGQASEQGRRKAQAHIAAFFKSPTPAEGNKSWWKFW